MLSDILCTRFVVHYSRGVAVRSAFTVERVDHDTHDPGTVPYIGFSVWAADVDRAVAALLKFDIKVAAVDGDINGVFDVVPRIPVMSYGSVEGTNYGSGYYRQAVKHKDTSSVFIEEGDMFKARMF